MMRVAPSRIRYRLTSRPPSLYGIRTASRWRIPRFQFHGEELLPGMSETVAELDVDLHPATAGS